MEPLTIAIIAGAASTLLAGGGTAIWANNKINKERAEHQAERNRLQKQIEDLLIKITEKDKIILQLQERIKKLDEEKLEETQKRNQLLEMIDVLEQRQKKLESVLSAVVAFITFRFGKWKRDKQELRQQLLDAGNERIAIENLLLEIEEKKGTFELQFAQETSQRDELYSNREQLTQRIKELE